MQVWTSVAFALVGCFVPLVLGSGGASSIAAAHSGDQKKPGDICSPYEVLKPTEPCCEPTCLDDCSHAICRRAPSAGSKPSCVCRQGYVRHRGSCIRKEACPSSYKHPKPSVSYGSYDLYRPVPLTKSVLNMQRKCSQNEELTYSRPYCEATCDHDCTGVPTPKTYIPEPSCVCKDGFVRHNGRCIQKANCPRRNPVQRRPLSGEYIDFEVVSLEGMKSEEDFDYSLPKQRGPKNDLSLGRYDSKKPPMIPVYLRTVANEPKSSGSCGCKDSTTEKPALFPPLCACRGKQQTQAPTFAPKSNENVSYESTEEDCDIVPYVPPLPSPRLYAQKLSVPLFPPSTQPASGPFYAPRKSVLAAPAHRVDLNEPVDHFYGSGQATSAQESSAGQEEHRKPMTIWPPVNYSCKRCGLNRKQR